MLASFDQTSYPMLTSGFGHETQGLTYEPEHIFGFKQAKQRLQHCAENGESGRGFLHL